MGPGERLRRHAGVLCIVCAVSAMLMDNGPARASERQVADGGAPWCRALASLEPYVEAILAGDKPAMAAQTGCDWLKAGVVVEVLRDDASSDARAHVVQVRVFGHGPSVDGYTLSNVIEDFHRPDGGSNSRR